MESFVRAKEGWQNAETTSEKKRKQFMEIFEGEDAADSGAVVSKKKHSKSKTKPAAAGGDDGEENDDEQQDIQMLDKAQKIYDSLLPTAGTVEDDDGEAPAVQDKNEKADEDVCTDCFFFFFSFFSSCPFPLTLHLEGRFYDKHSIGSARDTCFR